jgi:hypothetical protein
MSPNDNRSVDFEIFALQSGLFDSLPPPPSRAAFEYPRRDVDFEVLGLQSGLFDTLPPPPRSVRLDSLAPVAAASLAPVVEDPLPPLPVRRLNVARGLGAGAGLALMAAAMLLRPAAAPPAPAAVAPPPRAQATIELAELRIVGDLPAAPAPRPAARPAPKATPLAARPALVTPDDLAAPPVAAALPERALDRDEASRAVHRAARAAAGCVAADDARTTVTVSVTFAPSGRVTSAKVTGGPFQGTAAGGCVARALRDAWVRPFAGEAVTVNASVRVR